MIQRVYEHKQAGVVMQIYIREDPFQHDEDQRMSEIDLRRSVTR